MEDRPSSRRLVGPSLSIWLTAVPERVQPAVVRLLGHVGCVAMMSSWPASE